MDVRLPYVQYNLLLCRDNSLDLELICSSPPEFKGKAWKIYEYSGCDNDNTDFADPVDGIDRDQLVPLSPSSPEHLQLVKTVKNYFYISIANCVVFFYIAAVAFYLVCCGVRPRTLRRSGLVRRVTETHPLFTRTI
jgi:hypothetical protein